MVWVNDCDAHMVLIEVPQIVGVIVAQDMQVARMSPSLRWHSICRTGAGGTVHRVGQEVEVYCVNNNSYLRLNTFK